MDLRLQRLTVEHLADNVVLARAVGWPDTESDWTVLHAGAWVLGAWLDGTLVGQGALGLFGHAGTVAKMIVSPRHQRLGIGMTLLDALLGEAERRSVDVLGLVATPFGRPLYDRRAFDVAGEVIGLAGAVTLPARSASTVALHDVEAMLRFDRECLGCDRAPMLRARFREAAAAVAIVAGDGKLDGYALITVQGAHRVVGPIIARTQEQARELMCGVLAVEQSGPVRIDVPGEHNSFRTWLRTLGLREEKKRPEMARGARALPWQTPQRYALAAQAWG